MTQHDMTRPSRRRVDASTRHSHPTPRFFKVLFCSVYSNNFLF